MHAISRAIRLFALPVLLLGALPETAAQPATDGSPDAGAPRGSLYYSIRPDFRRCLAPLCGGYFVAPVNRRTMRCADGARRDECYVAEIAWRELGFEGDPGAALVQAVHRRRDFPGFGRLGVLIPSAAWRGAGAGVAGPGNDDAPEGRWFGLRATGIVCVAEPCYDIEERALNRRSRQLISGVDLGEVDAAPEDVALALRLLRGSELLARGNNSRRPDAGPAGDGLVMLARDFYLPLTPRLEDPLYCEVDAECTTSVFHTRVDTKEDCYCTLCPAPINVTAAKENQASWQASCSDYGFPDRSGSVIDRICPVVLCIRPPPVGCVNNRCVSLDDVIVPIDPLLR